MLSYKRGTGWGGLVSLSLASRSRVVRDALGSLRAMQFGAVVFRDELLSRMGGGLGTGYRWESTIAASEQVSCSVGIDTRWEIALCIHCFAYSFTTVVIVYLFWIFFSFFRCSVKPFLSQPPSFAFCLLILLPVPPESGKMWASGTWL